LDSDDVRTIQSPSQLILYTDAINPKQPKPDSMKTNRRIGYSRMKEPGGPGEEQSRSIQIIKRKRGRVMASYLACYEPWWATNTIDADAFAASACGLVTVIGVYFHTGGSFSEAALSTLCLIVFPILSLPFVKQQQPFTAAGINLVSYMILGGAWRTTIQDTKWRTLLMAVSLFAAIRSYDLAKHHSNEPLGRQYAGMVLLSESTKFQKVDTYRQLYSTQDVKTMLMAFLLIPTFAGLFFRISDLKSEEYYTTTLPTTWTDVMVLFARSSLLGMMIEQVLGSLTFVRRIFYAPFRIIHPSVMNYPFRSKSLAEYWSYRWNTTMHGFLKRNVYVPLLKIGVSKPVAELSTFFASGLFHVIMLCGSGVLNTVAANVSCMLFFLSQAALFAVERWLFRKNRGEARSSIIANQIFCYASIFFTAPLLIEPCLWHYKL